MVSGSKINFSFCPHKKCERPCCVFSSKNTSTLIGHFFTGNEQSNISSSSVPIQKSKKMENAWCQKQWPSISSILFCDSQPQKKLRWNFNYPSVCWDETFFFFAGRGRGLSRRWKCLISFCTHYEIKPFMEHSGGRGGKGCVCGCYYKSMRPSC